MRAFLKSLLHEFLISSRRSLDAPILSSIFTLLRTDIISLSMIPFIWRFKTYLLSIISAENSFHNWGILHSELSLKVNINFVFVFELIKVSKDLLKSLMYPTHFIEEVLKTSGIPFTTLNCYFSAPFCFYLLDDRIPFQMKFTSFATSSSFSVELIFQ